MKTILLTGSTGFIGNYFVNRYQNQYNIKTFSFRNDNFQKLNLKEIDIVLHLSALVHQKKSLSQELYEKTNIVQTIDLAQKAKKQGVKQFIFMSTIAVYGSESGFINEKTPCNPKTYYGKSKQQAEFQLLLLEDENFKISIIRPPLVYGYNAPGNMKSLVSLVKKVSILPFSNIKNKRSMVYIGNLAHLIDKIIKQEKEGIFLASDDKAISTSKLIEMIAEELGKKIFLIEVPFFEKILKKLKPDIYKKLFLSLEVDNSKTKQVLNLKNPYTLEEGIKYMIKGEN